MSSAVAVKSLFGGFWVTLSSMPQPREGYGATAVGYKIYYMGGNLFGDRASLYVYDVTTDSWSDLSPIPFPPRAEFGGVSNGTHVFAIGGRRYAFRSSP